MNVIAQLIKTPCTFLTKVPFDVTFQKVIDSWKLFCNGSKFSIQINAIFSVHSIKKNHIILYNRNGQENALLLCFINGRYMNLVIPNYDLNQTCVAIWFTP